MTRLAVFQAIALLLIVACATATAADSALVLKEDAPIPSVRKTTADALRRIPAGDSFPKDPSARSWLPVAGASDLATHDPLTAPVDDFLASIHGRLRPLVCWYRGSQLQASRALPHGQLVQPASRWNCAITTTAVAGDPTALDLTATCKLEQGHAKAAGMALAIDLSQWQHDNYVMIPCSVYNGNRARIIGGSYSQGQPASDYYQKGLPLTLRDLPHLALAPGTPSKLEVLTNNTGTPAICVLDRKANRGLIVLADQGIHLGDQIRDHALCVEESADHCHTTLVVAAPGVREFKPEFVGFSASPDRGIDWQPGQSCAIHLRLYSFHATDIPGLLEKFMSVRKAVTGPNHPRNLLPASRIAELMTQRIDGRFHAGKDYQFYCPENAAWISFGWVGGLMNTHPMLALGDEQRLARVSRTFDFAIPRGQGDAGYFYGALNQDGACFGREGYADPKIVLTRKNADVLFWMMKQFMLLKAQGRGAAIKPGWESNIRRLANAFVTTWKNDGEWGNYLHVDTGKVVIYNSTSAAQAMGGLALAAAYYHDPEYLRVAKEAADYYYQRDIVKLGETTGHSADTLQNADGDSPMAFAASLMALYETTGEVRWLDMCRNALNLFASWTTSFDYQLPKTTELGQLDAKLTGAIWASTQNKHAAPGHCTSSADPLLKVYRATGDTRYAELLHDIIHAHAEGIKPDGSITERLTYCDAEARGSRGGGSTGWTETNGLMMALEIPGIYLRTDSDRFFVFDSIEARVTHRDASGVTVEITNPTQFDADVSIFAENAAQAAQPQGYTAFLKWPKVAVKAGGTCTVSVRSDGSVGSVGSN